DLGLAKAAHALIDAANLPSFTAFGAGLAPRFQSALQAAGYRVSVADNRSREGLATNKEALQDSYGEVREFLHAIFHNPLGQILWADWHAIHWRLARLDALFPEARTLVIIEGNFAATDTYNELLGCFRLRLGLLADRHPVRRTPSLVTTYKWLPKLQP